MSKRIKVGILLLVIVTFGFIMPQPFTMPVEGATKADYNPNTFWYFPWGKSVTHKGVDIFAREGTVLNAATSGLVLYVGYLKHGGNAVLMLGPKWRLHYYAHLQDISVSAFSWKGKGKPIGHVGSSGNAAGKPPHLHYSIVTPIPYFWRVDASPQGWKKMFYLNPLDYLSEV